VSDPDGIQWVGQATRNDPTPDLDPEPTAPSIPTLHRRGAREAGYPGLVVRLSLVAGQSVLMMSEDQGLMSNHTNTELSSLARSNTSVVARRASRAITGTEAKGERTIERPHQSFSHPSLSLCVRERVRE
jgi:hypothetical protein